MNDETKDARIKLMVKASELEIKRMHANLRVLEYAVETRDIALMTVCVDEIHGGVCGGPTRSGQTVQLVYLWAAALGIESMDWEMVIHVNREPAVKTWQERMSIEMPELVGTIEEAKALTDKILRETLDADKPD